VWLRLTCHVLRLPAQGWRAARRCRPATPTGVLTSYRRGVDGLSGRGSPQTAAEVQEHSPKETVSLENVELQSDIVAATAISSPVPHHTGQSDLSLLPKHRADASNISRSPQSEHLITNLSLVLILGTDPGVRLRLFAAINVRSLS